VTQIRCGDRSLSDEARAIVLISFTLDEILALSDRILVLNEGRIVGEYSPAVSKEELGIAMTGARPMPGQCGVS